MISSLVARTASGLDFADEIITLGHVWQAYAVAHAKLYLVHTLPCKVLVVIQRVGDFESGRNQEMKKVRSGIDV